MHFVKRRESDGNEDKNKDEANPTGKNTQYPYNFYSVAVLNEDGKDDTEFWNKPPSVLRQACDNMSRLIFAANSRANWIFDLQMYKGNLYTWSRIDRDNGFAFGLQKKPFVFDIDFIDHNFTSVLTKDKESKWKHFNEIENISSENEQETLLKKLPNVVKCP